MEDTTQIINKLLQMQKRYHQQVAQLAEDTAPEAPDCAVDHASRLNAFNNKSINKTALANATDKLRNIEESLARIASGDFGICKSCGAPIAPERLMAMPESLYCIKCAQK